MLFKWFDFRGLRFAGKGNGGPVNIRNTHDLSAFNSRLGAEIAQARETLAESEKRSSAFLSSMVSQFHVPPRSPTRAILRGRH
jgi:hypothetical protein